MVTAAVRWMESNAYEDGYDLLYDFIDEALSDQDTISDLATCLTFLAVGLVEHVAQDAGVPASAWWQQYVREHTTPTGRWTGG